MKGLDVEKIVFLRFVFVVVMVISILLKIIALFWKTSIHATSAGGENFMAIGQG